VLLIDDGSRDRSFEVLCELRRRDPRFSVIRLSRNFGHQIAITAGIDLSRGAAVIIMDADLQDPPEVVLEFAQRWREGYEVVYGVRTDRAADSAFKRASASAFYRLLHHVTPVDIPMDTGDFRLVDRRAVEAFKGMREGSRFVRGMFAWLGFESIGVPYARAERTSGQTKYPVSKMIRLATDGIVGFSTVPLQVALRLGTLCSLLAVLAGVGAVGARLFGNFTVPGWASVVLAVCLLGGIQLAVLGVMGEYLGRTYEEVLGRPLYVIRAVEGVPTGFESPRRAVIAEPRTVASLFPDDVPTNGAVDARR
jgi:dolichol-phosphate mannosyltransferase